MWSSRFNYIEHYMTTFYKLVLRMLAASVVVLPVAAREHVSDERDNAEYGVENFTPGYEKPLTADSMPEAWTYVPENLQSIPGGPADRWWSAFSDPTLDTLIVMGVRNNYDLRMAARRREMARAAMQQAKAAWYPTVGVQAGWVKNQPSGATGESRPVAAPGVSYFQAGLTASWEIDIFGKIASQVKAERQNYRASRADFAAAMVSTSAQIASTYFTLREQQRLLQVAKAHSESQMEIVKKAQARFDAMIASKLDVAQAWQTYYSTTASIPMLEASIHQSMTALGILTGMWPRDAEAMLGQPAPLPNWTPQLPAGIPADLLRRRPDVVASEMQLAAAAARVGVARKDFLPTLTLEGSAGTEAHRAGDLFGRHSFYWQVTPTLSWTMFSGFARKYNLVSAREAMQEAIDSYNLTVMNAVGEADNAFNSYAAALRHIEAVQQLCVQNQEALTLAVDRYKNSLSPMTDVVDAQLNALSGESELVQSQASALLALVQLYEALGGGVYDSADK